MHALHRRSVSYVPWVCTLTEISSVCAHDNTEVPRMCRVCVLSLKFPVCTRVNAGVLNENCGADHVKTTQSAAQGMVFADGDQCASFDGDADRLMFFFTQEV